LYTTNYAKKKRKKFKDGRKEIAFSRLLSFNPNLKHAAIDSYAYLDTGLYRKIIGEEGATNRHGTWLTYSLYTYRKSTNRVLRERRE